MERGPKALAELARDVIVAVSSDPSSYSNLVGASGKRRRQESAHKIETVAHPHDERAHKRYRFTIYREIASRLGYSGAGFAVPLPVIAEQIVKIAFPGPRDEEFVVFRTEFFAE